MEQDKEIKETRKESIKEGGKKGMRNIKKGKKESKMGKEEGKKRKWRQTNGKERMLRKQRWRWENDKEGNDKKERGEEGEWK